MKIVFTADGFFKIYEDDDPNIPADVPEPNGKVDGFQVYDDETGEIILEHWFDE